MKKTIETIKAWLREMTAARKARRAEQARRMLSRESETLIQAREFNGEVYLCVNNEPIVPTDGLKWDLPTTLEVARDSWFKWKEKEHCYERR